MKIYFLAFFALLFSCGQTEDVKTKVLPPFKNEYAIFDEPSIDEILDFNYYLLIAEKESFGSLSITSVRIKDADIMCYYKIVQSRNVPPIGVMIKSDTISFPFTSFFIKMSHPEFDSIQLFTKKLNLDQLKDTIIGNHTDGVSLDILISVNGKLKSIYRNISRENELEPEIKELLQNMKRFTYDRIVPQSINPSQRFL